MGYTSAAEDARFRLGRKAAVIAHSLYPMDRREAAERFPSSSNTNIVRLASLLQHFDEKEQDTLLASYITLSHRGESLTVSTLTLLESVSDLGRSGTTVFSGGAINDIRCGAEFVALTKDYHGGDYGSDAHRSAVMRLGALIRIRCETGQMDKDFWRKIYSKSSYKRSGYSYSGMLFHDNYLNTVLSLFPHRVEEIIPLLHDGLDASAIEHVLRAEDDGIGRNLSQGCL